ncbi:MAG: hypothetical protein RMJ19_11485, partial [Gemmatales bacterium]|nr:hypothetical protein [Gemmatales bacterium]MDW8176287.1 hypothetical protein [Gemmatales bacterium]
DGSVRPVVIAGSLNFVAGNGANLANILQSSIEGELHYRGGSGNDRVLLRQSTFGLGINITSGQGNDTLEMFRSTMGLDPGGLGQVSGFLRFLKTAGDGTLKILQSVIHGELFASLNSGNDSILIQSSQIDRAASLHTSGPGADRDTVSVSGSRFYSPLSIRTGAQSDSISLTGRNQFFGDVSIDASSGNDVVFVANNTFNMRLIIHLGAGDDYVNTSSNRFFGSTALIDGGPGRDRIFRQGNQGTSSLRNFP